MTPGPPTGISAPFLGRLHHRAPRNPRRLDAGRVPDNPTEGGVRTLNPRGLLSKEICKAIRRASNLGVGLYPGASEDSWCPRSTLTWRPLMKHGGCDQLLVCNKLEV